VQLLNNSLWSVSIGSRLGAIFGTLIFGMLFQSFTWRQIGFMLIFLSTIAATLTHFLIWDGPNKRVIMGTPLSVNSMFSVIKGFINKPAVCKFGAIHAVNSSVRRLDAILPLYLCQFVSQSQAVFFSSVLPIGFVAGLATIGQLYKQKEEYGRIMLVRQLYVVCIGACGLIAVANFTLYSFELTLAMIFILAACCSVPYYLVSTAFCCDEGGENTGVLVSLNDGIGFGGSALIFQFMGFLKSQTDMWESYFAVECALLCVGFFLFRDYSNTKIKQVNTPQEEECESFMSLGETVRGSPVRGSSNTSAYSSGSN